MNFTTWLSQEVGGKGSGPPNVSGVFAELNDVQYRDRRDIGRRARGRERTTEILHVPSAEAVREAESGVLETKGKGRGARREEGPAFEVVGFSAKRINVRFDDSRHRNGQVIVLVYVTVADTCHICLGRRISHVVRIGLEVWL